jgi:uncharacterized delta-60 repeat protein
MKTIHSRRQHPLSTFRLKTQLHRTLGLLAFFLPLFIKAASNTLIYETSFEAPAFTPGLPIRGQDNWEMFHDGDAISVSTNNARTGTQCLRFNGALLEQNGPNSATAYCFSRALESFVSNPPPIVDIIASVRLDGPQSGTLGTREESLLGANLMAVVPDQAGIGRELGGFIVSSAGKIFTYSAVPEDAYKFSVPYSFGVYRTLKLRVDFVARNLRYYVDDVYLGLVNFPPSLQTDRLFGAYLFLNGAIDPINTPDLVYNPANYTAYFDDYSLVSVPLSPVNTVIDFASTNVVTDESSKFATVRLTRRGFTNVAVRVTLSTSDGTAVAAQDYQAVNTFVTFAPGETNKLVEIPLAADDYWPEPDKTFTARLTELPPGATSPRTRAMVVIRDDERPGSIDSSWASDFGLPPLGPGVTEYTDPRFVLRQPDGKLVFDVAVYDSDLNRQLYWFLVRLHVDGSVDSTYPVRYNYPSTPSSVLGDHKVTAMPNGNLLVVDYEFRSGNDARVQYSGHRLRYKLDPDGSLDTHLPSLTNSTAAGCCSGFSLIAEAEGNVLVAGNISNSTWLHGQRMPWLFRLLGDGTLDATFQAPGNLSGQVHLLKNGQILIKQPSPLERLYRLNKDGTLDTQFTPPAGVAFILPPLMEGLPQDQMLISARSGTSTELYRLRQDGTPDPDFSIGAATSQDLFGGGIHQVLLRPDGKLLVAGSFRAYNNQTWNNLVRLNTNGTVDSSFQTGNGFIITGNTAANPGAVRLRALPNGQLWVDGLFDRFNGEKVTPPIVLNADGSRDPNFEGTVYQVAGEVWVVGSWSSMESPWFTTGYGLGRTRIELPLRIVTANHEPDGTTHLLANALEGRSYTLQASENLSDWLDLSTAVATTNRIEFIDTPTTALPRRLYRVKQN